MEALVKILVSEVVAICDHLGFFAGGKLKHEVARKATAISLHLFVETFWSLPHKGSPNRHRESLSRLG
jgi:hypothetical protein